MIYIITILPIFLIGIGFTMEKYTWNKGKCLECGEALEFFDTDSQGGKGYNCTKYKHGSVWISYPCIIPEDYDSAAM